MSGADWEDTPKHFYERAEEIQEYVKTHLPDLEANVSETGSGGLELDWGINTCGLTYKLGYKDYGIDERIFTSYNQKYNHIYEATPEILVTELKKMPTERLNQLIAQREVIDLEIKDIRTQLMKNE